MRDDIFDSAEPSEVVLESIESILGDQNDAVPPDWLTATYGEFDPEDACTGLRARYAGLRSEIENPKEVVTWEGRVLLGILDHAWREHLEMTEVLREQSFLARQAQQDPLLEYRRSAAIAFAELQNRVEQFIARSLFSGMERWHVHERQRASAEDARQTVRAATSRSKTQGERRGKPKRLGRNAPCHCRRGKMFKHCCSRE